MTGTAYGGICHAGTLLPTERPGVLGDGAEAGTGASNLWHLLAPWSSLEGEPPCPETLGYHGDLGVMGNVSSVH